jgi:aldehyde dehydrogenase (NAD+)
MVLLRIFPAYIRRVTSTINFGSDLPLAQGVKFDIG